MRGGVRNMTKKEKVEKLNEIFQSIQNINADRQKIVFLLLYWKIFDGIDIPSNLMRDISSRGTNPESIFRLWRMSKNKEGE